MSPASRPVRALLRRSLLTTSALSLLVMGAFFTLFSYDLEDVLFSRLVAAEADRAGADRAEADRAEADRAEVDRADEGAGRAALPGMQPYADRAALPPALAAALPPGRPRGEYEVAAGREGHYHVAVRPDAPPGRPRYVAFRVDGLTSVTRHLGRTAGLLLASALLAFLAAALIATRAARRIGAPLEGLARALRTGGAGPLAAPPAGGVAELDAVLAALGERDARLHAALERERGFNRDVSHELRTPLAVARGALELLARDPPRDAEAFGRLRHAVEGLALLTEGVLWLGREVPTGAAGGAACNLPDVASELLALYDSLRAPGVEVALEADGEVWAPLPPEVARVVVGNLLKNALQYTERGRVEVRIAPGRLSVSDTGLGFGAVAPERAGFGVGLSLVERLATHFGWTLSLGPLQPQGTRADLTWRA
jgi:signal transduction histidine kinase